jgi:hypothetical protein
MSIRFSKIEDLLDERHRFSWEVRRIDDQIWIYLKSVRRKEVIGNIYENPKELK